MKSFQSGLTIGIVCGIGWLRQHATIRQHIDTARDHTIRNLFTRPLHDRDQPRSTLGLIVLRNLQSGSRDRISASECTRGVAVCSIPSCIEPCLCAWGGPLTHLQLSNWPDLAHASLRYKMLGAFLCSSWTEGVVLFYWLMLGRTGAVKQIRGLFFFLQTDSGSRHSRLPRLLAGERNIDAQAVN